MAIDQPPCKHKKTRVVWLHQFLRKTKKVRCPDCGHYTFVPYYNKETGQPFDGNLFGKCDRAVNCGCHRIPNVQDYRDRGLVVEVEDDKPLPKPKVHPRVQELICEESEDEFDIINPKYMFQSFAHDYWDISLFRWLTGYFPKELVQEVFRHYLVGYSPKYGGSPLFWQVDEDGNIRSGKIMGYNPANGKRNKNPVQIWYMHCPDYNLKHEKEIRYRYRQALYGEHLIPQYNKFAVCESEKTALIATLYAWSLGNREVLWLATSGLECIRSSIFRVLEGRQVVFFPDKGVAKDKWSQRIETKLSLDIRKNFSVNSSLERVEELKEGDDIGDYVIMKLNSGKNARY